MSNFVGSREEDYLELSANSSSRQDFVNNDIWDGLFSPSNGQQPQTSSYSLSDVFREHLVVEELDGNFKQSTGSQAEKQSPQSDAGSEQQQQQFASVSNECKEVSPSSHQSSSCPTAKSSTKSENNSICSTTKTSSNSTIQLDYSRLKAEHRKLKKYFEADYKNRFKPLPINETVRRLCNCEPTSLDLYISKQDKLDLLDEGLESGNWDVVITIILFIKRTLDNPIFRSILMERPEAAQYYVTYLKESGDRQELLYTLYGLGRIVEATMEEFKIACQHKDPKKKLDSLRHCLHDGFHHPDLTNERKFLEEWICLLETHTCSTK
ncbi:unnamed protein product [Meloidogyne enterolobii]|uniref:Uncharacterized protein n=1 Tax=Meloidogyne enterolobii TaxID=390850 RepID=A0ACB0Y615_MELEN